MADDYSTDKTYDRSAVDCCDAAKLATTFFPFVSVDEKMISEMPGYDDRNFYVEGVLDRDGQKAKAAFNLKVTNREESANIALIDAQNDFMLHLCSGGIPAPQPVAAKAGGLRVLHTIPHPDCQEGDPMYAIRLLTFLPGELLAKVKKTDAMLRHVGEVIGNISILLKKFPQHAAVDDRNYHWNLGTNLLLAKQYIHAVDTETKRQLVTEVMDAYKSCVLPVLKSLPMDYIHGDLNDFNIVMGEPDELGQQHVSGILDYGDIVLSYRVVDIAIAMTHTAIGNKDGLRMASRHILAGYQNVHPLSEKEMDVLYYLIAGRLCQICVISSYYHSLHPTNDYILQGVGPGWKTLREIWSQQKDEVDKMFREACSSH